MAIDWLHTLQRINPYICELNKIVTNYKST